MLMQLQCTQLLLLLGHCTVASYTVVSKAESDTWAVARCCNAGLIATLHGVLLVLSG
jgi:hypothetical protein